MIIFIIAITTLRNKINEIKLEMKKWRNETQYEMNTIMIKL